MRNGFEAKKDLDGHKHSKNGSSLSKVKEIINNHFLELRKYLNVSFSIGLILGFLITSTVFSSYLYWNSIDHRTTVPVSVVTCNSCDYEKFRDATNRMVKTEYNEIDYQSEKGRELIQKHNLKYIPGFLFNAKQLQKAENFSSIEPTLVKSDNAYVIPDEGIEVAQRLSDGKYLDRSDTE